MITVSKTAHYKGQPPDEMLKVGHSSVELGKMEGFTQRYESLISTIYSIWLCLCLYGGIASSVVILPLIHAASSFWSFFS